MYRHPGREPERNQERASEAFFQILSTVPTASVLCYIKVEHVQFLLKTI